MGTIKCVCISKQRKSSAKNVKQCEVTVQGMQGDVHFGMSRRRHVSMLPYEKIEQYFAQKEEPILYGKFGENLVVDGLDWEQLELGQHLRSGSVVMEIIRIGAATPKSDAYQGEKVCVPMEPYFVFCKVVEEGILQEEREIWLLAK